MSFDENNQSEFNDLKQVELSIHAAEHMVGQATRSMDNDQLQAAQDALNDARSRLQQAMDNQTGVDNMFLELSAELLDQSEHQLIEAQKNENPEK